MMSDYFDLRGEFSALLAAYDSDDDLAIEVIRNRILKTEKKISVTIDERTTWEESVVDGFKEFPVVCQRFRVLIGEELVYEGERLFGSSIEDPTHTGVGGRWAAIRIDKNEHRTAEQVIEDFGIEFKWPEVPPAR
jgi:hypothetical protein